MARFQYPALQAPPALPPRVISLAWLQALAEPTRRPRAIIGDGLTLPPTFLPSLSLSWFQPLAEPPRRRPDIAALAAGLSQVITAPVTASATIYWLQPLAAPPAPRRPRGADGGLFHVLAPIAPPSPATVVFNPLYLTTGPRLRFTAGLYPQLIATGPRLRFTATGRIGMKANDISPPIAALVETRPITFDFGEQLASGVTITGVTTITAAVHSGYADPAPQTRWQGSSAIITSPATGAASQAVVQQFGLVPGATIYLLQALVVCSDGSSPALETTIQSYMPS